MSLTSQVLRLDGQPEEEGNKQHHPGADAKDGVRLTARLMSSTKEHEQEAGAKHHAKDLAKYVDMDVIDQSGAEAGWPA